MIKTLNYEFKENILALLSNMVLRQHKARFNLNLEKNFRIRYKQKNIVNFLNIIFGNINANLNKNKKNHRPLKIDGVKKINSYKLKKTGIGLHRPIKKKGKDFLSLR